MTGDKSWSRQKAEIDEYNTFLSAHHSRASDDGFSERGYELVNYFPSIDADYSGTTAYPDFALFDGSTFLVAEIKQGNNFEERDIDQMERCNDIMIERAEEHLENSQVEERFGLTPFVQNIEAFIVYSDIDEAYIQNCRNEWEDCRENLEALEAQAPILSQGRGEELYHLAGEFGDDEIQSWLSDGIALPETPRTFVSMSDGMEMESVAATLCTVWGQRATSPANPVEVTISEVRQKFDHREIDPGSVRGAFNLLEEVGACEEIGRSSIEFRAEHMDVILDIESILSERDEEEGGEIQAGLDDWY